MRESELTNILNGNEPTATSGELPELFSRPFNEQKPLVKEG
jgi:hypothetical protein